MLARQTILQKNFYNSSFACTFFRNIQQTSEIEISNFQERLPAVKKRRQVKPPFAKNLFISVVDRDMLTYPEAQTSDRYKKFCNWMKPIEDYVSDITTGRNGKISNTEILEQLEEFNVFKARIPELYDGYGLLETEVAKLSETLSCIPWLSTYFIKKNVTGIDIICKHGSESQRLKYLPKIASRELTPTICVTETAAGLNIQSINTTATLSSCQNFWVLNGQKTFVPIGNNDSHLFLVFARCSSIGNPEMTTRKNLSLFLVEEKFGNITYSNRYETLGQEGVPLSTVTFEDVVVPKENMVGEVGKVTDALLDVFKPGNQNVAPQAVGILRHFCNLLAEHILQRRHQDNDLYEFEGVHRVMTKIAFDLFGMESALYLTTALADLIEDQDLLLEKAMVETYCVNGCVTNIYEGMKIIGVHSYMNDSPFMRLYKDALALTTLNTYEMDAHNYVALLGLQHAGKALREVIEMERNPMFYPSYSFKKILSANRPKNLDLHECLHLSFRHAARDLEMCLHKLKRFTIDLLACHGTEVTDRHIDLYKLSEIATGVYVLVATLGRASRSYCIGHRYNDYDRYMAVNFTKYMLQKIIWLEMQTYEVYGFKDDNMYQEIAKDIFLNRKYFNEHPLKRNYF